MRKIFFSLVLFICLFSFLSFNNKRNDNPNGWFRSLCRIAGADACGAWNGFSMGARFSGGNPYITGGATVIVGAVCSVGASGMVIKNPNPLSPDVLNSTFAELGTGFGEKHNKMLNYLLSKKIASNDVKAVAAYYQNNFDPKAVLSNELISSLSNSVFKYETNTDNSINELYVFIEKNINDTETSTFINELLKSVYSTTNLSDALSVISAKEKEAESFPTDQRQLILAGTNVLKASLNYWSKYSE